MELADVQFTFDLDLKAADSNEAFQMPVELENGDMLIEGIGANYDLDREDEAFEEGAFTKGLKTFLAGNAPLCYHHKMSDVIGKVIEAVPIAGKGIKIRAIVDHQPENSPLRHIYEGIKKGRINQLSCGGIFKRRMTENGPRIHDVDLMEWSATPVAVGRGTNFSVIAGKALEIKSTGVVEIGGAEVEEEEKSECEVCKQREKEELATAEAEAREIEEKRAEEERAAAEAKEEAERLAAESEEEIPEEVLAGLEKLFEKLEKLSVAKTAAKVPDEEVSEHPEE